MAITATRVTEGGMSSSGSSVATASVTPTTDRLQLLTVNIRRTDGVTPVAPSSVSGCGVTWVLVASNAYVASGTNRMAMFLYRAMGTPTTGTVTITFGYTAALASWTWDEIAGVDTSGTDGSAAIQQISTGINAFSSPQANFTVVANASNPTAMYGAFGWDSSARSISSAGSGYAFTSATIGDSTGNARSQAQFKGSADVSDNASGSGSANWGGIGLELKAAGIVSTHYVHTRFSSAAQTHATASISPNANRLLLFFATWNTSSGSNVAPTVTGLGLTWVKIAESIIGARGAALYRAMGTPSSGAVTADWGAGNATSVGMLNVDEIAGVDTTGTNGSGAVVQSAVVPAGAGATPTATLAAFGNAANGTYGAFGTDNNVGRTAGTGFTLLGSDAQSAPSFAHGTEFKTANDTSVDLTWGSSVSNTYGIAIEVAAPTVALGPVSSSALHLAAHLLAPDVPRNAEALHLAAHLAHAESALATDAGTLHLAAHLAPAGSPIFAGPLHLAEHVAHAERSLAPPAERLHRSLHLGSVSRLFIPPAPKATELVWVHGYDAAQTMAIHALLALELDDRLQDSETLRFTIAADDPKAGFVLIDTIARYRRRFYRISQRTPSRDGTRAVIDIEAEALWIDLASRTYAGHFFLENQTPAAGLATILAGDAYDGWEVDVVDPPIADPKYGIDQTDAKILGLVREWAKITGCELVFDTEAKTVSMVTAQGEARDLGFRYAWNLTGIKRRETPPACTRLYAYGRNGLSISAVNVNPAGEPYVEDFSYYEAQGLTSVEAEALYLREQVWKDDAFISDSPLYDAAVARLAILAQPVVAYEARVMDLTGAGLAIEAELGDTVPCRDGTLGIAIRVRVVRLVMHPLEPHANAIELEYLQGRLDDSGSSSATGSGVNGEDWRLFLTRSGIDHVIDDATVELLTTLGLNFAAGFSGVSVTEETPIEVTLLAANDFSGGTSWVTDSYAPEGDALLIAFVTTQGTHTNPPSSLVGNGLTWHLIDGVGYNFNSTILWAYRAMGPMPISGALTVNIDPAGLDGIVHVLQATGVTTDGVDGAGAIAQFEDDRADESATQPAGPSITVTLGGGPNSKNAVVAAIANDTNPAIAITPGDGYAALGSTLHDGAAIHRSMLTEWKASNEGSADASTPGTHKWMGIILELVGAITESGLSGTGESVHHFDAVGVATGDGTLEISFAEEISGEIVGPVIRYDFVDGEDVHIASAWSVNELQGNQLFGVRITRVAGTGSVEFLEGAARYSILAKGALGSI